MAITRNLPNSDEKRNIALNTAKNKKDNTAPPDIVITPNTVTRLDATQPLLSQSMQDRGNALQAQSAATAIKVAAQVEAKKYISDFIQTFNNGVARGTFPASHRAFYQLDVSGNSVPPLDTEALVTLWGQRLIDGDAARIAAGGAAMAMPTIAEVTTKSSSFTAANTVQSTAKDAYDVAQEVVSGMRIEVDKLILRIWDEVETAFNDEPIESKRRDSREWGVVYVSTQKATITGNVTDAGNGNPLPGVNVTIAETGDTVQTLADGKYILKTDFTGEGTLEFALAGFVTQTFPVDVPEGGALVQDAAMVVGSN